MIFIFFYFFILFKQYRKLSLTNDDFYRNLPLLCPLWVSALKEYARVQVEPDVAEAQINVIGNGRSGGSGGNPSGSSFPSSSTQTEVFDSMYSGLTREVILPVCYIINFFLREKKILFLL